MIWTLIWLGKDHKNNGVDVGSGEPLKEDIEGSKVGVNSGELLGNM